MRFLTLHARRAGERYGIDPRDILAELGRRQAVAGQEDWILDVALELARGGRARPSLRHEQAAGILSGAVREHESPC